MSQKYLEPIDNYIYIYHLGDDGEFCILPSYPESVSDSMQSNFGSSSPLARTAPIYSYSHSGPRIVQFNFEGHREMMTHVNQGISTLKVNTDLGEDYIDALVKKLQACSVPNYLRYNKNIVPPQVAIRLGETLFIKGIINGSVQVSYKKPILSDNKYALVSVSFSVAEVDPYDADSIAQLGSFRGLTKTMKEKIYK